MFIRGGGVFWTGPTHQPTQTPLCAAPLLCAGLLLLFILELATATGGVISKGSCRREVCICIGNHEVSLSCACALHPLTLACSLPRLPLQTPPWVGKPAQNGTSKAALGSSREN